METFNTTLYLIIFIIVFIYLFVSTYLFFIGIELSKRGKIIGLILSLFSFFPLGLLISIQKLNEFNTGKNILKQMKALPSARDKTNKFKNNTDSSRNVGL